MGYYQNQFGQWVYQPDTQPPMDRLAQLQSQRNQAGAQMFQANQPPQTNQGIIWVQGEAAARSYLVAPNTTVLLMDSESQTFYLKSTDTSGMPMPLRIFDYTERTSNQNVTQNAPQSQQSVPEDLDSKYVTREEYSRLQAKYAEILDKLDSFQSASVVSEDTRKSATSTNKSRGKGGDTNGKSVV